MRPATAPATGAGSGTRGVWGPASGVNVGLTPRPASARRSGSLRVVENDEYARFTRRVVTAHGRRVATGDVEGLRDLAALDALVQDAIRTAVAGLRGEGFSWADIGSRLGVTRQAAHQRWGAAS